MVTYMEERQNSSYRYERKFVLASNRLNGLYASLYSQNYFEQYPERRINNIYYDNYNFSSVSENLDGLSKRKKYRVRWYGEKDANTNKTLEVKEKDEFLNYKINVILGQIKLNDINSINNFNDDVLKSLNENNEHYYQNLLLRKRPTLFNSYKRLYFQNPKYDIRLTIDSDLYFFSPITNLSLKEKNIIIEAKFNKDVNFLNKFKHLSLTRYSKYVKGTLQTSFFNPVY